MQSTISIKKHTADTGVSYVRPDGHGGEVFVWNDGELGIEFTDSRNNLIPAEVMAEVIRIRKDYGLDGW